MAECSILYNHDRHIRTLKSLITGALIHQNPEELVDTMKVTAFSRMRVAPESGEDETEVRNAMLTLYRDAQGIVKDWNNRNPDRQVKVPTILTIINRILNTNDNTQRDLFKEYPELIETKTVFESNDMNTRNLNRHLAEFYGTESARLLRDLRQAFTDSITGAAFVDRTTWTLHVADNEGLNKRIREYKNSLFETMVRYLKAQNPDDPDIKALDVRMYVGESLQLSNFFDARNAFYNLTVSDPGFRKKVLEEHNSLKQGTAYTHKQALFRNLVNRLRANTGLTFVQDMERKFNKGKVAGMADRLYEYGELSQYFRAVKEWMLQNSGSMDRFDMSAIDTIESQEASLLNAANAYTILTHFDSLLSDTMGNEISIRNGFSNVESGNKYSYNHDTTHQKSSWNVSDDFNSATYLSKMSKAVLNTIEVYDWRTGEPQYRRVNPTALISAMRNLMDNLIYGKIFFSRYTKGMENAVYDFPNAPETNMQYILEELFGHGSDSGVYHRIGQVLMDDYDLSTLKSVYHAVFDKSNPQSFWNQEQKLVGQLAVSSLGLVNEITGFVNRNVPAVYLETRTDSESGGVRPDAKKKFFTMLDKYKHNLEINNRVNNFTPKDLVRIRDRYSFTVTEQERKQVYQVTVPYGQRAVSIRVLVPNNNVGGILGKNFTSRYRTEVEMDADSRKAIDNVNLFTLAQHVRDGAALSDEEQFVKNILDFVEDTTGLKVSASNYQVLDTYRQLFASRPTDNMDNYLFPLITMGMRGAYVADRYLRYMDVNGSMTLQQMLENTADPIYFNFRMGANRAFTLRYGDLRFLVASYQDDVLDAWSSAEAILKGDATKTTTFDSSGNAIPTNSISKLGCNLHAYLRSQRLDPGTSTSDLLLARRPQLLKGIYHDLEYIGRDGTGKGIEDMTAGELAYHAIWHKFFGRYLWMEKIIVQPTCYSDKQTYLNYELLPALDGDTNRNNLMDMNGWNLTDTIIKAYMDTVGKYYMKAAETVRNRLIKILNHLGKDADESNYRTLMHDLTEEELVRAASECGETVELYRDYVLTDGRCCARSVIDYNARLYNDYDRLREFLNHQKNLFIKNLLDEQVVYQVLDGRDTLKMYLTYEISERAVSKNTILHTINRFYRGDDRIAYMREWVDESTGRLILAKQTNPDGTVRNILQTGFDPDADSTVNPLLEKFFYIEGFMSNQIRLSLTGSEINHPADKNSPLKLAKKVLNRKVWNETFPKNRIAGDKVFQEVHEVIRTALDVSDLERADVGMAARKVLDNLIEANNIYETNTSQGRQFKRNNIIPAPLQGCTLDTKDGIPSSIRCAVIRDVQSPVYNFRNTREGSINACDGSAQITPFQCILENRSLGSQSVGFVRKPIWHAYDTAGGTAFLAKFAAFTMTNEAMNMSFGSALRLRNLFKKMTNIQWDEPVDLTKALTSRGSFGNMPEKENNPLFISWFRNCILNRKYLYHKNVNGDIWEITSLFRENIPGSDVNVYYTIEQKGWPVITTKVYHLFDGDSAHLATTDINEVVQAMASGQYHTINSLYELHAALGGLQCCDVYGNASEQVNEVVVNYMNNIGYHIDGRGTDINQTNYRQPLKHYHIGYALNETAVKNGAKNINQSSAWMDDSALTTFEVNASGLGIQLNADHDITNDEITEFSQVIAASTAYGYTFDNTYEIFQGLALSATEASAHFLEAVDGFVRSAGNEQARSDLYDAVGRIIFMNRSISNRENLTNVIMQAVQDIFNRYSDHANDELKIPFSDPNIYSTFIATIASTINSQSIKRKHPGSGCVMVPAYDMIQYYEVCRADGTVEKLFAPEIERRANSDYYGRLLHLLHPEMENSTSGKPTLDMLEQEARALPPERRQELPPYFTELRDPDMIRQHRINTWLESQEVADRPVSWFMPSDIVDIFNSDGAYVGTVDLDSLDTYYAFKDGTLTVNGIALTPEVMAVMTFRPSVRKPHNLRPSTIRWQARSDDGTVTYRNIFDLQFMRDAWKTGITDMQAHRTRIQQVMNGIAEGTYFDEYGRIMPGTLENEPAELVMSNIYKETFGIENESLNEVLRQGEDYFRDRTRQLVPPAGTMFDLAFLRDNGRHTLISLDPVPEGNIIQKNPFTNDFTDKNGRVLIMRDGQPLFQIAQYVDSDYIYNPQTRQIISPDGHIVSDTSRFRILDNSRVQERLELLERYTYITRKSLRNGETVFKDNTLYRLASQAVFDRAFPNADRDMRAELLRDIYRMGDYQLAQFNSNKQLEKDSLEFVNTALQALMDDPQTDEGVKEVLRQQYDFLSGEVAGEDTETEKNRRFRRFTEIKDAWLQRQAHAQWVSFQDSLKFISSRIPAQTLQSFMAMKLVGWTMNSSNTAYVSHFQTYLQGSDYDIDKAWLLGQNYDSNSIYIKWSPYFDYTDLQTLEASKRLPIPKHIELVPSAEGADISVEAQVLLDNSTVKDGVLSTEGTLPGQKLLFLDMLARILQKVEQNGGRYNFGTAVLDNEDVDVVLDTIRKHENYDIPRQTAIEAYKNVASANIYAVSHDVRNRDHGYTPVNLDQMKRAAEMSPKGSLTAEMNMLNPMTKYEMQRQNMVGKSGVGVAANGNKFFFNAYAYWNIVLESGNAEDMEMLRFRTTLNRVAGRASGTPRSYTVTHLPDLCVDKEHIRQRLVQFFDADEESVRRRYADIAISELITAATDNAKELVLAKINADLNYMKMFVYLISTGYNLSDIAAFMTSPAAEFIISTSGVNIFQSESDHMDPVTAINMASGKININNYLHGGITEYDPETGEYLTASKRAVLKRGLIRQITGDDRATIAMLMGKDSESFRNMTADEMLEGSIKYSLRNPSFDLEAIIRRIARDPEIQKLATACGDLAGKLRQVQSRYAATGVSEEQARSDMEEDIREFRKIYDLSTDISRITTAYLGLNQGIPTDHLSLFNRLYQMNEVIRSRERLFGIREESLWKRDRNGNEYLDTKAFNVLKEKLQDNNRTLTAEVILDTLTEAHRAGLIGGFDIVRLLENRETEGQTYWELAKRYNHILKGTVNILDMMEKIPHYRQIMDDLRGVVLADSSLSYKSRIVRGLLEHDSRISQRQLDGIIRYADRSMVLDFLQEMPEIRGRFRNRSNIIDIGHGTDGFDIYFNGTRTDRFDLQTLEGIAGFRYFMEHGFLSYLRENYPSNPLVPHLTLTVGLDGGRRLATDIDTRYPDISAVTQQASDDIASGMAQFENVWFDRTGGYTITDMFMLYNIIVNSNGYGNDTFTTAFRTCSSPDSVLQHFLAFEGMLDQDTDRDIQIYGQDYQINAAPVISEYAERYHTESYVKVRDLVWGYILKEYHRDGNYYTEKPIYPIQQGRTQEEQDKARANFLENCPFEMPVRMNTELDQRVLNSTSGELSAADMELLRQSLQDLYMSGKLFITREC